MKVEDKYPALSSGQPDRADPATETRSSYVASQPRHDGWDAAHKLFDFLDDHPDLGILLVTINGDPTLHFRPGLDPRETERWQLAELAVQLLANAVEDLRELIGTQAIVLPRRKQMEARSPPIFFGQ